MTKSTNLTVGAFLERKVYRNWNGHTDGKSLFLFGNEIAKWKGGNIWISSAGWFTNTTKRWLNQLPGVMVSKKNGVLYLNGKEWDGTWVKVGSGEKDTGGDFLKTVATAMKAGEFMTDSKKEAIDWKVRMLKAGLGNMGLIMPKDWDTLTESEKDKRLNAVMETLSKVPQK